MLATGHPELSVDDLFEDELIGDFVKSIQIDCPTNNCCWKVYSLSACRKTY